MLTVPQEIKDLLHLDTCKKNIRIHFPNGERSDVCNDLIVKNSVKFTESLCSQDELKFGLCESPVFECETVGVGNIKGATIEVYCEVYCDQSISGAEFKTDLQAYVYPIPYGFFVVDTCKRQADMIHRRIVAYYKTLDPFTQISWFESIYKASWALLDDYQTFTPTKFYFLLSCLNLNPETSDIFNEVSLVSTEETLDLYDNSCKYMGNSGYEYVISGDFVSYDFDDVSNANSLLEGLFRASVVSSLDDEYESMVQRTLDAGVDKVTLRYGKPLCPVYVLYDNIHNGSRLYSYSMREFSDRLPFTFYGYCHGSVLTVKFLKKVHIKVQKIYPQMTVYTDETEDLLTSYSFKGYQLKSNYSVLLTEKYSFPTYVVTPNPFNPSELHEREPDYSSLAEESDVREFLCACFEIAGQFGVFNRYSDLDMVSIKRKFGLLPSSTLYPNMSQYPQSVTGGSISPEDYQSCWYDDEYTKKFGAVICNYTDTNNQSASYVYYLPGYTSDTDPYSYLVYDLSDNKIIQSYKWSSANIQVLCQNVAVQIENVSYMPVDFVGRGLPYVEAGDTFEILTRSNDSITTIVLNKTTSGEQTLTDSYKSV